MGSCTEALVLQQSKPQKKEKDEEGALLFVL